MDNYDHFMPIYIIKGVLSESKCDTIHDFLLTKQNVPLFQEIKQNKQSLTFLRYFNFQTNVPSKTCHKMPYFNKIDQRVLDTLGCSKQL